MNDGETTCPTDAELWDVIVVGGGAAGLMAAQAAAERGRRTLLLEKNRKLGVKILMSGGTRCNLTQATDRLGIVEAFGPNGRFLHSALAALGVEQTIALFEAEGVPTKVEATGKVFPASDRAADVLAALVRRLRRTTCEIALGEPLVSIERAQGEFHLQTALRRLRARKVIITSGGRSFPGCGTTGDGYSWASHLGHTIVPTRPALVPLVTHAAWPRELKGITIPDALVKVVERTDSDPTHERVLAERRGSLLFTHFGLSGPAAMDVSRVVSEHAQQGTLKLVCDFLPGVSVAELEARLRAELATAGKRQLASLLPQELPRRLIEALLRAGGLVPEQKAAEVGHRLVGAIAGAIKQAVVPLQGTLGYAKAEVTAGGVSLDEIDSRTMQSKLVPNLYFAGEVLDLDGLIGGYNFQAAWSTGHLAGTSV